MVLTQCAHSFITPDIYQLMQWYRLASDHNLWPAGTTGTANAKSFLDGFRYCHKIENRVIAMLRGEQDGK